MKKTTPPFDAEITVNTKKISLIPANQHLEIDRDGISVSLSTLRKLQYFMPEVLENKNIHVILDR